MKRHQRKEDAFVGLWSCSVLMPLFSSLLQSVGFLGFLLVINAATCRKYEA